MSTMDQKESNEDCSPAWLYGSRFWMLQSSDEEEEGEEEVVSSATDIDKTLRYLCRTPSPVSGRDIVEDSSELPWRTLKRIKRRDDQRMATKAAMALTSHEGTNSPFSLSLDKISGKTEVQIKPAMEPSVFLDNSTEGWTIVRRRRWLPVIDRRAHDPRKAEISNVHVMGLARLRASRKNNLDRCGPFFTRHRLSTSSRSNGD
jgi:hypothetical protein